MKYRVKQIGDKFYPQYKYLFWWAHYSWAFGAVEFDNLEEAREYLDDWVPKVKLEPLVKIHQYPDSYNPDAHCNMTAALKQSECGTTCCTPDEE